MANRLEFYPLEVGAQHLGATSFSVYNTLAAEQMTYVFTNAGDQGRDLRGAVRRPDPASGAAIEHIVCIDGSPEGTITARGDAGRLGSPDFDFESAWRAVQPDDVADAHLHLGHHRHAQGRRDDARQPACSSRSRCREGAADVQFGDRITSYLPSAHIADRMGLPVQPGGVRHADHRGARRAGRSPRRCPTAAHDLGRRARACGRSSRPASFAGVRTSRTRPSGRGCSGRWRVAAKKARPTWWPGEPLPDDVAARVRPGRRAGPVEAARQAGARPAAVVGVRRGADPDGDVWRSSRASASRSPRSGACPS